jgi:hypothetical protein
MPIANWGVAASDVDDFDRSSQFTPYRGPQPPTGRVFEFAIKNLKYVAGTKESVPQLRVGLELDPNPRRKDEEKYRGYFTMAFLDISDKMMWKLVPFLDAIGVSGVDFTKRTVIDEDGNVKKIGKWKNSGEELIAVQLKENSYKGKTTIQTGWMGPILEDDETEEDDFDEEIDDPDAEYDEEDEGF